MKTKSGILRITKAAIILVLMLSFQASFGQLFNMQKLAKKKSLKRTYRCESIGVQKVKHVHGRSKSAKLVYITNPLTETNESITAFLTETKPEVLATVFEVKEEAKPLETEQKNRASNERELRLLPNPVYFRYDSYRLDIIDLTQIALAVTYVKEGHSTVLVGHTDNWGSEKYNEVLSAKRANIIRDIMIELGCNPELIAARGEGEKFPADTNDHDAGRQSNRRVEFLISLNAD